MESLCSWNPEPSLYIVFLHTEEKHITHIYEFCGDVLQQVDVGNEVDGYLIDETVETKCSDYRRQCYVRVVKN